MAKKHWAALAGVLTCILVIAIGVPLTVYFVTPQWITFYIFLVPAVIGSTLIVWISINKM